MALKIVCPVDDTWLVCENAYFKILWDIRLSNNLITFSARIYSCQEARLNEKNEIESRTLSVAYTWSIPTDETERIALLYELTKVMPEYASAIDI